MIAKPDWIGIDSINNRVVGAAGAFGGSTQAEADARAQNALNNWSTEALADGSLYCYDFPELLKTVNLNGGGIASQATWDPDNQKVWALYGFNGSTYYLNGIDVNTDVVEGADPGLSGYALQYVPDYGGGALQAQRLWFSQNTIIGHFLPASPYTKTNVFTGMAATGKGPGLWIPEEKKLFTSQGVVSGKLRMEKIDFVSGVRTEQDLTGVDPEQYQYCYNPVRGDVVVGASDYFDIATMTPSNLALGGSRASSYASAYCPENQMIYAAYVSVGIYGIALLNASDYSVHAAVDFGPYAITGVVYHEFRKYMYVYGASRLFVIDTAKYNDGSAMLLGSITWPKNITRASGVYCPLNRYVYIANPATTPAFYVIT